MNSKDQHILCFIVCLQHLFAYVRYKKTFEFTFELVGEYLLPEKVNVSVITPLQEIKINLDYRKVRINKKETIHFVIPQKYGECR